jgi:OOP family OmpA-OmpF porin
MLCLLPLWFAVSVRAQDSDQPQDAEGCKDSPPISRLPGSVIHSCETKEFEQADFPLGGDKQRHVEGDYHYWDIGTRDGTSEIQVFRNFQTALKNAGFTVDFADSPGQPVAHKDRTWIFIDNRGSFYYQTIVTEKAMKQEVTADASALGDAIKKSGHVAVYGIQFDTGKAAILPDSQTVLNEIVKLLEQDPDLKLRVEGHTDNQGNAAANQLLSLKGAEAVVAWLAGHGVSAGRLGAKRVGADSTSCRQPDGRRTGKKSQGGASFRGSPGWQNLFEEAPV